jgi:hypothetical protein
MTSFETLECRRYMAENRMFEVQELLCRHLDTIEKRVSRLAASIHEFVRRSGSMPLDEKTFRILGEIQAVIAALDLSEAKELASRVADLEAEVSAYEEAIEREQAARTSLERLDEDFAVAAA